MRKIAILGGVVLLLVVGWVAAWFVIAGEVRKNIAALAVGDGLATPTLSCGRLDVGGFPFRFDATCTDAAIVSGDLTVTIADLRASVLAYQPFHILAFARGPANIADAFSGAKSRVDWTDLELSARLTDWRIARVSLIADSLAWTDTLAGETPIANAAHAELHLVDIPERLDKTAHTSAVAVYSALTGVTAAAAEIADGQATLEAELSGLPDDVRAFGDPDPLQRWQQAGGNLKLVGLKGNDPDQSFAVSGNLALDSAGRVDGQLDVASTGLVERFGSVVPPDLRGLILGSPATDGSYKQIISIRGGVIFSGIMPTGVLPPLW